MKTNKNSSDASNGTKKKWKAWKIVLLIVCLLVVVAGVHGGITYYLMSGTLVDNGWDSGQEYSAQITDRGVPAKYEAPCTKGGSIVEIDYMVECYSDPEKTATKHAFVYLPDGYSSEKEYNILYLYHGSGGDEGQWFEDNPVNKNVVDNLIFYGDIEPLIIVTPNYFYQESFGFTDNWDFSQLAYELRNNLIPSVETKYSTYAHGDISSENLTASRDHRAIAGLSMGGRHTLNSGMMMSLDIMSWFGYFSGTDNAVEDISAAIHSAEFEQYPINFLLAVTGKYDMPPGNPRYEIIKSTMAELAKTDSKINDGKNYLMIDVVNGGHNMDTWEVALYNFLLVSFRN